MGRKIIKNYHNFLGKANDLAKHMACQLVEYMLLNATKMDTDKILRKLREIAMCWKPHREQVRRVSSVINEIKTRIGKYTVNIGLVKII